VRSRKHILVERELFKDKIRGVPNIMEKANYKLPKEGKEQKVQLKQSMEEITIKSMIKSMGKTYKETMSETLMGVVKLVNNMIRINHCYTALYIERRIA